MRLFKFTKLLYSCHNALMSNAYIFYGKAGSGKGTQALELKRHLESQGRSVLYVETGGLFRNFIASNASFAAKRTREVVEGGHLMPAFFPVYLWAHELIQNFTGTEDIIFDGVARRIEEAPIIDSAIEFFSVEKTLVFHIDITDETAIERLQNRGQGRADDASLARIRERLDLYRKDTVPVIEYFRDHGSFRFAEIDGEPDAERVTEQVVRALG